MKRSPVAYSSPVSRLSNGRPTKSAQVVSWMLDCGRGHSGIKFNNRNPHDRLAREFQRAPAAERNWVRAPLTLKMVALTHLFKLLSTVRLVRLGMVRVNDDFRVRKNVHVAPWHARPSWADGARKSAV
jgi:hypothetical protein